ncbi:MAG: hypothetical protein ACD_21C00178G0002 [uncultured bacterium]|nr:MAG: hypothetical protein ACD_21C00178G0002 [uncultured bacterium]
MKFPNKLIVTLKSTISRVPLSNNAIYILVRARKKNDYNVGLRITNDLGQASFSADEMKDEIEWTRRSFIMDYSSSYEECASEFYVVLFSNEGVQKCKSALKLYLDFDGRVLKDFELIQLAHNSNLAEQKWKFNAEKLTLEDGIAHVECLVDGA